jgi:hypothetical protein
MTSSRHFFLALLSTAVACSSDNTNANNYGQGDNYAGGDSNGAGDHNSAGDPGGTPGTVTLADTCPTFTPCGGTLPGTWHYTNACFEKSALFPSSLFTNIGCGTPAFGALSSSTIIGSVAFATTQVTRSGTVSLTLNITTTSGGYCTCGNLQSALAYAYSAAVCTGTATCVCTVTFDGSVNDSTAYTAAGNVITLNGSRTFDYCVSGNTLKYKETTATDPEPGIFTAAK